jgi:hypothetical protein
MSSSSRNIGLSELILTSLSLLPYSNIQGDQKASVELMITVQKTCKNIMATTEYIWNVDRAILNTVFKNTVQSVNKCLETGGGHFEHYLYLSVL